VFGAVAGNRILQPSRDVHFVYQAHAWLHGRLAIEPMPRGADDPAKVETVLLDDGSEVRGRRLRTRRFFRTTHGDEIPLERVRRTLATTTYNSFPPGPALLLVPQTLVAGKKANDVLFTLIFAAFVLPLGFAVMRRLNAAGLADRSRSDQIWLVVGLAFGTVLFFSAVQGRVWYTAHVVGVVFCLAYVWCAIEARHPILAGCALAFAAITRTPMAFMFPLFFFEAWRMADGDRRAFIRTALAFSAPVAIVAIAAAAHNYARFDELTEFGHSYLQVRQQAQIEQHGLFSHHYLSRNLAVAFTLLPDFSWGKPWVVVSGHGLAIWFTTPIVLLVLWPRVKGPLHRPLWVTIAFVAVPTLFYQNSGWFQFGYRFALDYMVFLFVLLAVGGRPLTRVAKVLIIAGIVINLFGAYTFDRVKEHYKGNYGVVISH
jgi:hypothetical protein